MKIIQLETGKVLWEGANLSGADLSRASPPDPQGSHCAEAGIPQHLRQCGAVNMLVVTELHYHRNGVFGAGYYAGKAQWKPEDETFYVQFVAFTCDDGSDLTKGSIAILGVRDISTSYRYEDFDVGLRKFIVSRGGQVMAFPHTLVGRDHG